MNNFDIIAHYQFGYYAQGTAVEPTPEIIGKLMEVFKTRYFNHAFFSADSLNDFFCFFEAWFWKLGEVDN